MGETHRTKHNTMSDDTIDCTPSGCRTPEGVARVNAALTRLEASTARCANLLQDMARSGELDLGSPSGLAADDALQGRQAAYEELVSALTAHSSTRGAR